jgi:hypothetical protein
MMLINNAGTCCAAGACQKTHDHDVYATSLINAMMHRTATYGNTPELHQPAWAAGWIYVSKVKCSLV